MRIAINGFGRIGRAAAKIIFEKKDYQLVAVNDLCDPKTIAHLYKYDSIYGIDQSEIIAGEKEIEISGEKIKIFSEKSPENLPWEELGVDVVIESTGHFRNSEECQAHLRAGAKKVIISAPAKDEGTKTFVIGVNEDKYQGEAVISNASCTTNCIAPIMKVLSDKIGVKKSLMTTVHSYTADQVLVDGPHKDFRRARGAAQNIVPTTTGAATATAKTIPSLNNKFDGLSIRVPTPIVSLSDITFLAAEPVTVDKINQIIEEAALGSHQGIIQYSKEPLVSSDIKKNSHSAVFDSGLTYVVDGDLVKVIAWYDNEWGYSCRLVEMISIVSR